VILVCNQEIEDSVSSEDRPAQDVSTQGPEQADISDISRFESWRAHHLYKFHIVMSLRPRDHSPLVCAVAGGTVNHDSTDRPTLGAEAQVMSAGNVWWGTCPSRLICVTL
jgi:hypothetical protein